MKLEAGAQITPRWTFFVRALGLQVAAQNNMSVDYF